MDELLKLVEQFAVSSVKTDENLLGLIEAIAKRVVLLEDIVKTSLEVQKQHLEISKFS